MSETQPDPYSPRPRAGWVKPGFKAVQRAGHVPAA